MSAAPPQRFTCITCRVAFKDADTQRSHYKTDWHRYNLKRKVAELLPVSAENFQDRVLARRDAAVEKDTRKVCEACKKHFTSENSYDSHLRSRKHRETAARLEKRSMDESVSQKEVDESVSQKEVIKEELVEGGSDGAVGARLESAESSGTEQKMEVASDDEASDVEPEPLELTECLFCPRESLSMEDSLRHMSKVHGFFIPELDYLVDLKGLISYLCEKVGVYYTCLYCNDRGKMFHSVESVQQHMVDKCHCKLFFEGDAALEYAEYYDYTKSYSHKETLNAEGAEGSSDDQVVPDSSLAVTDELELVLPSGARVGHRALRLYYKQNLPTLEQRKSAVISRLMAQYRALGWKESGKGSIRRKDAAWAKKMQSARDLKLSVKANSMQHHFRPQVVF